MVLLLVAASLLFGVFFSVFSVGVALWVICKHLITANIPAGIRHPFKLRVLDCLLQLIITWGMIFEKLRICSMPTLFRFVHDLMPLRENPDIMVTDLHFGTVPVKLYQPKTSSCTLKPGFVFYHGGGGIIGSLKTHHQICCRLCKESNAVVLSVGYRMVPQHRFPTPITDCTVATIHFLKSVKKYGVDPTRVVVGGDSAGGGIAAVICQKLMDYPGLPKIRAQILIYAVLQLMDFQLPSSQQNKNVPLINEDFVLYCCFGYLDISPAWRSTILKRAHLPAKVWEKYEKWLGSKNIPERFKTGDYRQMPPEPLNEDAYLETKHVLDLMNSPLIAGDEVMSRLPEACIVSCEYDFLRDHSLLYKKRLEDLGVPVTWHHVEDGFHGVLNTLDMGWFQFSSSTEILNAIVHFIKGL